MLKMTAPTRPLQRNSCLYEAHLIRLCLLYIADKQQGEMRAQKGRLTEAVLGSKQAIFYKKY